jgi:hypothetical protein
MNFCCRVPAGMPTVPDQLSHLCDLSDLRAMIPLPGVLARMPKVPPQLPFI